MFLSVRSFPCRSLKVSLMGTSAHTSERDQSDRSIVISRSEAALAGCVKDVVEAPNPDLGGPKREVEMGEGAAG